MVFNWLHIAIIGGLIVGVLFAAAPLAASLLLAPKARGGELNTAFECGMAPHNQAWGQFGINYYVYALLFLAFDVDVLYLFPAGAHYQDHQGWTPLVKVFIFIAALGVGCLYFWKKGVFQWPNRRF